MRFKSRRKTLRSDIKNELLNQQPNLNTIMGFVDEYEVNNINTIERLRRGKTITMNRIKGGITQAINAHGPIDTELIPSLSKRIYGAILSDQKKNKINENIIRAAFTIAGFILYYIIWK